MLATQDAASGERQAPALRAAIPVDRLARRILWTCVGVEILLVLLDYFVNFERWTEIGAIRRMTNIAREDGLANWFGATQTLLAALTLWALVWCVRRMGAPLGTVAGWMLIAILFSWMAIDDGAQVHERLGTAFDSAYGVSSDDPAAALPGRALDRFPSYAWMLVVLPVLAFAGLFTLVFLWRNLRAPPARAMVVGAFACLLAAIGLDFIEGLDEDHAWNVHRWIVEWVDFGDWTQYRYRRSPFETVGHFSKTIEETLEMFGNTLLWVTFVRALGGVTRRFELTIDPD